MRHWYIFMFRKRTKSNILLNVPWEMKNRIRQVDNCFSNKITTDVAVIDIKFEVYTFKVLQWFFRLSHRSRIFASKEILLTSKKSSKSEKVMLYYAQPYHYLEIREVLLHSYFTSSAGKNVLKTFQSYFYILMPNSILIINMYEIAKNDELMCLKLSININGKHCLKMDVGFLFSSLECFTFRRNR